MAVEASFVMAIIGIIGFILILSNWVAMKIEIIEDITDYISTGGRLGWPLMAAGMTSLMDWGGSMMTAAEGGYTFGIAAPWMYSFAGIGAYLLAIWQAKLSKLIPYPSTIVDIVRVRFDKVTHIFFTLATMIGAIYIGLIQGLAMGFLTEGLTDGALPYWAGILALVVIAGAISIWSGGWSTFIATWFSALVTAVVTVTAGLALWFYFGGGPAIADNIASFVAETGRTEFANFASMDVWISYGFANFSYVIGLFMMADTYYLPGFITKPEGRSKGYFHGATWWMMVPLVIGMAGVAGAAVGLSPDEPSAILPLIMTELPTWGLVAIASYIVFASCATFGISALSFSSLFSDMYRTYINPDAPEEKQVNVGRYSIVAFLIGIGLLAGSRPGGLVYIYLLVPVMVVPMGIPFVISLWWEKLNGHVWVASAAISMIIATYVYFTIGNYPAILVGLASVAITLLLSAVVPWEFDWREFKDADLEGAYDTEPGGE